MGLRNGSVDVQAETGEYAINVSGVVDRVELRPDGTYLHSFLSANDQLTSQTGSWTMEPPSPDGIIVTFEVFIMNLGARKPRPGFFPAVVEKGLHPLRLVIDRNLGRYYEKQSKY